MLVVPENAGAEVRRVQLLLDPLLVGLSVGLFSLLQLFAEAGIRGSFGDPLDWGWL